MGAVLDLEQVPAPNMDPASAAMVAEVAAGVISALVKSRKHIHALRSAMQGAKNENSVWFASCKELGDNCQHILPVLRNLEAEMRNNQHAAQTRNELKDLLEVLASSPQLFFAPSANPVTLSD